LGIARSQQREALVQNSDPNFLFIRHESCRMD
jgi:hypothetical protein